MGPIARSLIEELRRQRQSDIVDLGAVRAAMAEAQPPEIPGLDEMPPGYARWLRIYGDLSSLAYRLLGLEQLRPLQEKLDRSANTYGPGDGPLSGSFHSTWTVLDATTGDQRETLAEVVIELIAEGGGPGHVLDTWRALADSFVGAYVVKHCDGCDAQLADLVTGRPLVAQTPARVLDVPGTLWLTRLLPPLGPDEAWASLTTPYALRPDMADEWRAYIARATGVRANAGDAAFDAYRAHMKRGLGDDFGWFDYIDQAAYGSKDEGIVLEGVPDRPDSMPTQLDGQADDPTPLERVRDRLLTIAKERDLTLQAVGEVLDFRESLLKEDAPPDDEFMEHEEMALHAYCMYGARGEDGKSALDTLAAVESLPDDELAEVVALRAGWFSVFEVTRVRIDEGMELRDIFRRRRIWVTERTATREVYPGVLLAAWLQVSGDEAMLEGAVFPMPHGYEPEIETLLRDEMGEVRRQLRGSSWRERHNAIVPFVVALATVFYVRNSPQSSRARPTVVNPQGHELVFATAYYDLVEGSRDQVRQRLDAADELKATEAGRYLWFADNGETILGGLELGPSKLAVCTQSREELQQSREFIARLLPTEVAHRADSFEDPMSSAHGDPDAADFEDDDDDALPLEVARGAAAALQAQLHSWLDESLPALGDKTLRQVARSQRGRDNAEAMLAEQERSVRRVAADFADNIDFASLWEEVGLEYRGPFGAS